MASKRLVKKEAPASSESWARITKPGTIGAQNSWVLCLMWRLCNILFSLTTCISDKCNFKLLQTQDVKVNRCHVIYDYQGLHWLKPCGPNSNMQWSIKPIIWTILHGVSILLIERQARNIKIYSPKDLRIRWSRGLEGFEKVQRWAEIFRSTHETEKSWILFDSNKY